MFSLNKWNQREVHLEILMVYFCIACQFLGYPLKLMRNYLKTLGLFMAYYDQT
jgi:hypothetical protein